MIESPKRIVSLVPSETFNVCFLGALDRLVGRTRYCVEPPEAGPVPVIGGTKDIAVQDVIDLEPDLILANQEENRKQDVQRLIDAGLNVRLVFPKTVEQGLDELVHLAALLQSNRDLARVRDVLPRRGNGSRRSVFVPIWRNPWMTVNDETYIGDVVGRLGLRNVFGSSPSVDANGADVRYPVVTLEQVLEAQPEMVLLPDEPYRFREKHVPMFAELEIPAREGGIICVSGRDLCWHGAWAIRGMARLREQVSGPRNRS